MADDKSRVLVVDDNQVIRKLAQSQLAKKGYNVKTADDGLIGIEIAQLFQPHVILLDVMMPKIDGFEVCRKLKNLDATKDIPVIMVTSKTESVDKITGLEIGAADYVPKPFDHGELQARVATQVKMKRLWDELQEKNRILEELIKKDGLTNLYNHRYFHEYHAMEFTRSMRYRTPMCCVLSDIDHFKKINDAYGHQAGDSMLVSIARIMQDSTRENDFVARYGGEEFALVLPNTNVAGAEVICERLRAGIAEHPFAVGNTHINVTISMGIAEFPSLAVTVHGELINCADTALYAAKSNGRNRVEVFRVCG